MADGLPIVDFQFGTTWELDAEPDRVFAALGDLAAYPQWWPQVRCIEVHPDLTCVVTVTSFLPRTLTVTLSPRTADEISHRLGIWITGDMQGWAQWLLSPGGEPGSTVARYNHEVAIDRPRWRARALAGPMRLNQGWLFRQGRSGLRRHLAQTGRG